MRHSRPSMKTSRTRQHADAAEHEDYLELTGTASIRFGTGTVNRKALQLCSQVAETLNYVLSGDCDDELLQNLQVASVVPAPNASQLLVTVYPVVAGGAAIEAAEVRRRLSQASGRLRTEVARSITRKKAPNLLFQVVEVV
jgi:ribosome-binding factor A